MGKEKHKWEEGEMGIKYYSRMETNTNTNYPQNEYFNF
jgi:hypothetical protein